MKSDNEIDHKYFSFYDREFACAERRGIKKRVQPWNWPINWPVIYHISYVQRRPGNESSVFILLALRNVISAHC